MNQSIKTKIENLIESREFLKITNPIRYMGGEFGAVDKSGDPNVTLRAVVCFPDLYEIGMSNAAVKIMYEKLNGENKIFAERVFLPDSDAIDFFNEKEIALFSLESKTAVKNFDFLLITVGSELLFTNILKILELSGIPLHKEDRSSSDPIVIIGGPSVTNPAPLARFADFVCIGEFEACMEPYLRSAQSSNLSRKQRSAFFEDSPHFWRPGKKAVRAVIPTLERRTYAAFPVSSVRLTQDHGSVEIMRGCPNGCRFCHAGIYYRPVREKALEDIVAEIDDLVFRFGYREISLASLSTGDYSRIDELMKILSERYRDEHVSFSLPSIKVNSFTLDLLETVAGVKKSGLTLAIETPGDEAQISVNKNVSKEKLFSIIDAAKQRGWKLIKLYFMIGLPYFSDSPEKERDLIINLIRETAEYSRLSLNINVGTFIPKPHTPFQYSAQLPYEKAKEMLYDIKAAFREQPKIKVNYHDPFLSYVESILSKGGEEVGEILEEAYRNGAFMDAWSERFNRTAWEKALISHENDIRRIFKTKEFPWQDISLRVSSGWLKNEYLKSMKPEYTAICSETCQNPCGSCNQTVKVNRTNVCSIEKRALPFSFYSNSRYFLLRFSRERDAAYLSQRNMISFIERIFYRAGLRLGFTEGFNRKPKLEFANPLPLGFASKADYLRLKLYNEEPCEILLERLNRASIPSVHFSFLAPIEVPPQTRLPSLMSVYSASEFLLEPISSASGFSALTDRLKEEAENNRFLTLLKSDASAMRLKITEISPKKILPEDGEFGVKITRTESFFIHPVTGVEEPFSNYPDFFKK